MEILTFLSTFPLVFFLPREVYTTQVLILALYSRRNRSPEKLCYLPTLITEQRFKTKVPWPQAVVAPISYNRREHQTVSVGGFTWAWGIWAVDMPKVETVRSTQNIGYFHICIPDLTSRSHPAPNKRMEQCPGLRLCKQRLGHCQLSG